MKDDSRYLKGIAQLAITYGVTALAIYFLFPLIPLPELLWKAAAADIIGTIIVFAFSMLFNNSSMYDPYWSVAPIPLAGLFAFAPDGAISLREGLIIALVCLWGTRLTVNFMKGFQGAGHEDWRYMRFRSMFPRAYWLVSFSGIHFFPTLIVFAGCLPLAQTFGNPRPFVATDLLAAIVTLTAIGIEALSDAQLRRFVRTRTDRAQVLDTGLWKYSRHPNYFGEILFWWGIFLFAVHDVVAAPWILAGPLSITTLFAFISVPLIDRAMLEKRPTYAAQIRARSAIVPWFRSR